MTMQVALSTLKAAGWNSLYAGGHMAGSFLMAAAINKIAHLILRPAKGSDFSVGICSIAGLIALAVSVHLAPQAAVVSLTVQQVWAAIAVSLAAIAAVEYLDIAVLGVISLAGLATIIGAATGGLGTHLLPVFGGLGAIAGGAILYDDAPDKHDKAALANPTQS